MGLQKLFQKILCGFFILFLLAPLNAEAYVSVKGYYRKDGTYVQPYVRSNPNGIKTDNYGYKPSDGVYNKTYGTRGSEWDTPTTITDPDYYEGKQLYENNQVPSTPTNIPAVTSITKPTISLTPAPALISTTTPKPFVCDNGFVASFDKKVCIKIPDNAHQVVSKTDLWLCDAGYSEHGNSCVSNPENTSERVVTPVSEAEPIKNNSIVQSLIHFFQSIFRTDAK